MTLSRRQTEILATAVEVYLATGKPVSSQAIAERKQGRTLSSATVRNELQALTTLGLLRQTHASGGRVPTERALRTFVDELMHPKLHPWDRTHLDAATRSRSQSELPVTLGHALSTLTGEVAVVGIPRFVGTVFREVGLVRCNRGQILAYFVSADGTVQQKLVQVDFDVRPDELQRIQNYLNDRLTHRTLPVVRELIRRELRDEETRRDQLRRSALEIGVKALPDPELEVVVDGTSRLASKPELLAGGKLESLLRAVEDKKVLLRILDQLLETSSHDVTVMLGSEHDVSEMADLACVGASCSRDGQPDAAITLLGPARMDYRRVVALVRYATELFERQWCPF